MSEISVFIMITIIVSFLIFLNLILTTSIYLKKFDQKPIIDQPLA